jgi:hypothetical protein
MPAGSKQTPALTPPAEQTLLSRISMRVSLGLSDALHRLGIMGAVPASHAGRPSIGPAPCHVHSTPVKDDWHDTIPHKRRPAGLDLRAPTPATPGSIHTNAYEAAGAHIAHGDVSPAHTSTPVIPADADDDGSLKGDSPGRDAPGSPQELSPRPNIESPAPPATPSMQAAVGFEAAANAAGETGPATPAEREGERCHSPV